jgi:hypothetical protein
VRGSYHFAKNMRPYLCHRALRTSFLRDFCASVVRQDACSPGLLKPSVILHGFVLEGRVDLPPVLRVCPEITVTKRDGRRFAWAQHAAPVKARRLYRIVRLILGRSLTVYPPAPWCRGSPPSQSEDRDSTGFEPVPARLSWRRYCIEPSGAGALTGPPAERFAVAAAVLPASVQQPSWAAAVGELRLARNQDLEPGDSTEPLCPPAWWW